MKILCISFATFLSCFASSCVYAQGNLMDLLEMSEKLDRADKQDLQSLLGKADTCTAQRNFSCSESNIERAAKLVNDSADKKRLESSRQKIITEKQLIARETKEAEERVRLAEESRRRREEEENRRQMAQSSYDNSSANAAGWNNYFQQQRQNYANVFGQLDRQQRQVDDLKRQEYQRQQAQEQARRERAQQEENERQRQLQAQRDARNFAEQAERERQSQMQAQRDARDRAEAGRNNAPRIVLSTTPKTDTLGFTSSEPPPKLTGYPMETDPGLATSSNTDESCRQAREVAVLGNHYRDDDSLRKWGGVPESSIGPCNCIKKEVVLTGVTSFYYRCSVTYTKYTVHPPEIRPRIKYTDGGTISK